ncbi:MAG: OmpA family protein [Rhizobiaceae bacterium]|nr:OmpA family protein [Rhizobiaceae bacterium]
MRFSATLTVLAAISGLVVSGCVSGTNSPDSDQSLLGKGLDSFSGLVGRSKQQRSDELIGAGVDAVTTAEANPYMDQLEKQLNSELKDDQTSVVRAGNQIILSISSASLFEPNQNRLRRAALDQLNKIAAILQKNDRTTVDVYGYTDAGGDEKKNLELTQTRALAVARHLAGQGVDTRRLSVTGFGSSRPVEPNDTDSGRVKNRRIEIQISAVKRK